MPSPHDSSQVQPIPKHAQKVFQGEIFAVWQWEQELYDGSTATFERLTRPDYAYVIAVLPDERIMLVQDEQPDREAVLTPAGGKVEQGEDAAGAAMREFKEETGYEIGELIHWNSYRPSKWTQMQVHAFVGRGAVQQQEATPEAGEKITPVFYTFDEFVALGHNQQLRDWLLRINLLEAEIDPAKRDELKTLLYG